MTNFLFLVKDKAAVLAEVSKLQDIRDELTSEVTSLHAQLEIERSKNVKTSSAESKSSKQSASFFFFFASIYKIIFSI